MSTWARYRRWLLPAVAVPVAVVVAWQSQRVIRADWASASARQKVVLWVAGSAAPESQAAWEAARDDLLASFALTPDDPDLLERLGDLYVVAGQRDAAVPALKRQHFAQAADYYEAETRVRPGSPQAWAMLAASSQAMGAPAARVNVAWARALELGPYEGDVQPVLLQVTFADWDAATPAMRTWTESLFDHGNDNTRRAINAIAARYGSILTPDSTSTSP